MASATAAEELPGRLVSPWLDGAAHRERPPLAEDITADVAVVGAGIVGLSTALALARAGASVAVLETRRVGSGVSGNTTAKLTSLHGLAYRSLRRSHGRERAAAYAAANQFGLERVAETASGLGIECGLRRKPNHTYTADPARRGEVEAAREAGLAAELVTETELPFPVEAAVRVGDQAEFQPVAYLLGLADELDWDRQRVYERTRAVAVEDGGRRVRTAAGPTVACERVVVATQLPFLDRGLFFARAHAEASYALSARIAGPVPQGMYLSVESPTRSLRALPWDREELLVVGGAGHELGRGEAAEGFADLARFARETWEVEGFEHRWGAHDYVGEDGLPQIGRLQPFSDRVLVATALRKWGLAIGTAAAAILAEAALGREHEWAEAFDPWRLPPPSALPTLARINAKSGAHFVADRLDRRHGVADLAPGEGRVVASGLGQRAVYRDEDGNLHAVSARCTHLGCIVRWNGAERTWDCPCHGSRFGPTGELLSGPATADLSPQPPPSE